MDRQPVLTGELVLLRPLTADDRDDLFAVASDPLLWEQHPINDRWRPEVFRAFFDETLREGGALVAVDRQSGAIAGSSQFRGHDAATSQVEIGWTFLARSHWGGPMNREMKRLMLGHALKFVERVDFRVGETNWRSRRAMEKIGGRLTDRNDIAYTASGPVRHVVYEITREGFAKGPLAG